MDKIKPYIILPSKAPKAWLVYLVLWIVFVYVNIPIIAVLFNIAFVVQIIANLIKRFKGNNRK